MLRATWHATVPPTAGLTVKLFGARYLATLFGLTLLSHQIGDFFGAWLGGVAVVSSGSYLDGQQRELPLDVVGLRRSCARGGVGEPADPGSPSDLEPGCGLDRVSVGFGSRLKGPDDILRFNP